MISRKQRSAFVPQSSRGRHSSNDGKAELEPDASETSLASLQEILRKKLLEPLDVELIKDLPPVYCEADVSAVKLNGADTENVVQFRHR